MGPLEAIWSKAFFSISKIRDPTATLGNLFQHLITLTVKNSVLIPSKNFSCCNLCLLPLTLSLCQDYGSIFSIANDSKTAIAQRQPVGLLFPALSASALYSHHTCMFISLFQIQHSSVFPNEWTCRALHCLCGNQTPCLHQADSFALKSGCHVEGHTGVPL